MVDPNTRVWRYMSFGKLVWILQKRQLWFSRADLLGDRWELTPDSPQLNAIINKRPPGSTAEAVTDRVAKTVKKLRATTFVNCWNASEHESHALWRIYCPSSEGVAIQTTLSRLREIGLPVEEVVYGPHGVDGAAPEAHRLVTQKRPMFAYENEVRIIFVHDFGDLDDRPTIGAGVDWDPEKHLECVWIHPEAQYWFMETVTEAVRRLAPSLCTDGGYPKVWWSKMQSPPPF
jgi:hypothetical protein